jgi:hypothetical protein
VERADFFTNSRPGTSISVSDDAFVWSEPGAHPANPAVAGFVGERNAAGAWTVLTFLGELLPQVDTTTHRQGHDCALDGDTLVIGNRQVASGPSSTPLGGSVYVLQRSAPGAWSLRETLRVPGSTFDDGFGAPVALDGNVLFVGAPTDDDIGTKSGSVFAFRRP